MDKHKGRICFTERLKIEENLKANLKLTEISKKIGRAMSTLYQERLEALEMQVEIILQQLEKMNVRN